MVTVKDRLFPSTTLLSAATVLTVGAGGATESLSLMLMTAVLSVIAASVLFDRTTLKLRAPSTSMLSVIGTWKVLLVWPAAKVSLPLAAV